MKVTQIRIGILAFVLCLASMTNAQHERCGTTIADQLKMDEIFKNEKSEVHYELRDEKIYIPVKFHLLANNDGSNRIAYADVLNQLARLNRDYYKWNMVFFLKDSFDFHLVNKTSAFTNPRANEDYLDTQRDPNALNIFVVDNIGDSGTGVGIVLGYYSPTNDFVVSRGKELSDTTNTLSHEVGHFFNLRHTFFGWEEFPYNEATHGNPYTQPFAPGSNIQTELVNRSNCVVAADQLCDTPTDFNFGITQNGCNFNKIILDKNMDTIRPMKNNQMSYFSNCAIFEFTQNQFDRMKTNYETSKRNYIRTTYVAVTDSIAYTSIPISPATNEKVEPYNAVYFNWEDQGAQYYLLEIKNNQGEYYAYFTTSTEYLVQELKPNKLYFYTVRAFNDAFTDTTSPLIVFRTGTTVTATEDNQLFESMSIFPNPVSSGSDIIIDIKSERKTDVVISIMDNIGRELKRVNKSINIGSNLSTLSTQDLTTGMYLINIIGKEGVYTKKVVIQ